MQVQFVHDVLTVKFHRLRAENAKLEVVQLTHNLGTLAYEVNDYPLALEYFQESLKSAQSLGALPTESYISNCLAILFDNLGMWGEAEKLYFHKRVKNGKTLSAPNKCKIRLRISPIVRR